MSETSQTGGCLCGGVRFHLTEPATDAGYCHCTRCQRRTGAAASPQARIAVTRGLQAPLNLVISNVPGSPLPLYLAGAKLEAQYPISAIIDGSGLNITLLSYRDRLDFGVVSDPAMLDDAFDIVRRLDDALEELKALVPAPAVKARKNGSGGKKAAESALVG